MSNKENGSIISGFLFENKAEAAQAAKETEGVDYIRQKTDMNNPEMVLNIYNKMVQQDVFETAVGYSYLIELQDYLKAIPFIRNEDILPIRVQHPTLYQDLNRAKRNAGKAEKGKKASHQIAYADYKQRYQVMTAICIILAVCVATMFFISATGSNPNILNYENKLIDKYEVWEQELVEREKAVVEKEQSLRNIQE